MFQKKYELYRGMPVTVISGIGECDLTDTFECGQVFRYEEILREEGYAEFIATAYGKVIRVGQRKRGELILFGTPDGEYEVAAEKYFALTTDFEAIRRDVISRTDSEWLVRAAESAKGIVILKQDPWEMILSFIISQNNNIPRIRKIIRSICAEYGENLAKKQGLTCCPVSGEPICDGDCKKCGICYSFPTPREILDAPERLLPSRPGFRYKYMLDAARMVDSGEIDLEKIEAAHSCAHTVGELKKILGVGDKVASCAALFGFANYEAFPIDVWMRRAIDEHFGGNLSPESLGDFAGVAQQYIFHYQRNLAKEEEKN